MSRVLLPSLCCLCCFYCWYVMNVPFYSYIFNDIVFDSPLSSWISLVTYTPTNPFKRFFLYKKWNKNQKRPSLIFQVPWVPPETGFFLILLNSVFHFQYVYPWKKSHHICLLKSQITQKKESTDDGGGRRNFLISRLCIESE